MPLDRSALDAGTEAVVDGGTITDSDDQWGPWVPIVPVTVPSVSPAPDAPAIATVPSVSDNPDGPAITTVLSVSHNPDAPAITTVPSASTAIDAPATSPVPLFGYYAKCWFEYGASGSGGATNQVSACSRSRGYSRPNGGWGEIFAGVRKIASIGARMGRSKAHCGGRISYTPILCQRPRCSYAVLTGGKRANGTGSSKHYGSWRIDQRLGAGSRQTFCNGPRWDYHPINGDRGLDASKLHPKPKRRDRCPSKDARGSPLDGVHKYVAALQRDASVSPGDAIESIGGRNRGGVQHLCCFEQYTCSIHRLFRLSGFIWGWSDQTTFIYPSIGTCASSTTTAYFGLRGTGSWPGATIGCCCYHYYGAGDYVSPRQCLQDRTAEVYWLAYATAAGGGAFTLSGPGVSSACGGIVVKRTNRTVFVAHIAPERANEVVYNPWIGCTGVVREAYQFVASQDSQTSAVIPHPANGGTSLRFWHDKDPMLDWGVWRMFKPMVGWWKIRNPELDWFLGGPRFELWNLKDKTPKRLRPNRGGTSLFLPRQKNWCLDDRSG